MLFHIQFTYASDEREELLRSLKPASLKSSGELKVKGAWVAAETGFGWAVIETTDARALYALASEWSDNGQVQITPVLAAEEI